MRIYLVRHGQAVSDSVDSSRPLSEIGKREIGKVAQLLKNADIKVPTIFHSTEKRAQQTAEIIHTILAPSSQLLRNEYLLPNESTNQIMQIINSQFKDFMIVGHLPFLSKLTSRLVLSVESQSIVEFDTGTMVALEKVGQPLWQIAWVVNPSLC